MENKELMIVEDTRMEMLASSGCTGMNFCIVESDRGFLAVMEGGEAMPLYTHQQYYCIDDHLKGIAPPSQRSIPLDIAVKRTLKNRQVAVNSLQAAKISQLYAGGTGAFPLLQTEKLGKDTLFKRYINSNKDRRHINGKLTQGTYLTSEPDSSNANTGFGAVGRYALPIPLPASNVIDYVLKKGTTIEIGTVAPLFGQSGGGVEIHCPKGATVVKATSSPPIDDY